ncbi:uncharacterized protein LOC106013866 [Aplysia californica]|uniref:Uncharacterized protein LOC106013866 n=1 Tax=Aplysia californica TaxID=6500 RepID=A0ABM1AEE6_APLCA|nr:uncharacterized protein LOC106013866 [Aplysia californica]
MDSYSLGVVFFACITTFEPAAGADYLQKKEKDSSISFEHDVLLNMLLWEDPKIRQSPRDIVFMDQHLDKHDPRSAVNHHMPTVPVGVDDNDEDEDVDVFSVDDRRS